MCARYLKDGSPSGKLGVSVGMTIERAERILIEATLRTHGNNKTKAAEVLGISAKTLHAKLRQYRREDSAVTLP
jgi:DNA-binding NtrC family response regulator